MNDLDGASMYPDLPRAACEPTPAPTPAPTPVPTPAPTFAPEPALPASPACDDGSGNSIYDIQECATALAGLGSSWFGSTASQAYYFAVFWPGDAWCDPDFMTLGNAC